MKRLNGLRKLWKICVNHLELNKSLSGPSVGGHRDSSLLSLAGQQQQLSGELSSCCM